MQSWATFLRNHGHEIWAFDSPQAYDLLFRPLFAFFLAPAVSSACRCSPNSSSGGQILQVEEGNRPSAGELRQRPVPALDRLVLDEERREGLQQELVRLGLRLGLDQRRLRVPLDLGDLGLREGLLALQLVLRLLGLAPSRAG